MESEVLLRLLEDLLLFPKYTSLREPAARKDEQKTSRDTEPWRLLIGSV